MPLPRPRFSPPAIFLTSLCGMVALAVVAPGPQVLERPANLSGLVPVLLGILLHASASRRFRRGGTTVAALGEPSVLVRDGVYGFTRNPMYLAGVLILAGTGVFLGSATPFLAVPVFAWSVRRGYIVREERMLEQRFGEDYARYRSRVRRWI